MMNLLLLLLLEPLKAIRMVLLLRLTGEKLPPSFLVPSGNELNGSTYQALFSNAKSD